MAVEQQIREKSGNICVVGCGYWGKNLIRNFWTMGHLKAICDSNRDSLAALATQYPGVRIYGSLSEALADPELDAFVLATPAEQHHRMALAAIKAGKDVFVEKPLALNAEDGLEMVEAAHARGSILMVGHLLRYHPAILKIQEMVAEGDSGPPRLHILQPPQHGQNPAGGERSLEFRAARYLRHPGPGRTDAGAGHGHRGRLPAA